MAGVNRDKMREEIRRKNARLLDMLAKEDRPVGSIYDIDTIKPGFPLQNFAGNDSMSIVTKSEQYVECYNHGPEIPQV